MNYFLNRGELEQLINYKLERVEVSHEPLAAMIELCESWGCSIFFVNYYLSKIIEQRIDRDKLTPDLVKNVYGLKEVMNLQIEEFNADFIDFLISSGRDFSDNSLEDELLLSLERYISKKYGSNICY